MFPSGFSRRDPLTMEKQKQRTKTAAWWTFIHGKGREGQQVAIGQWALPAADRETNHGITPHPRVEDSPQEANAYTHPEVLNGILVQP